MINIKGKHSMEGKGMLTLKGKYNVADVYNDFVESSAQSQIIGLLNMEAFKDSSIKVMSDVHAGKGCVIGLTMTVQDKIIPNFIGVDIGCGMQVVQFKEKIIDFKALDEFITNNIPAGTNVREKVHSFSKLVPYENLKCKNKVNLDRATLSIGTLGGGNHFIEVDKDEEDNLYLIIHTGSRYLGKQVCEYYQEVADSNVTLIKALKLETIKRLKEKGDFKSIQPAIEEIEHQFQSQPKGLGCLSGTDTKDYLHDMGIVQGYASINRLAIAQDIEKGLGLSVKAGFSTIHNYIDLSNMILRKGAVSARLGEKLLIPINMRDGSLLCIGKGNKDWNYSAPHGAGRLMSRSKAKEVLSLEKYKAEMAERGIYTTSVSQSTLDECADAYKPMEEIISHIKDTVIIEKVLKPVYNFKFGE